MPSLEDPPVDRALAAFANLIELFAGRVFVVSYVYREDGPAESLEWLEAHGFLDLVPRDHVTFVPRRILKGSECQRLGATHAIDDQLERVLLHLTTVRHRIWFTGGGVSTLDVSCPNWATRCDNWDQSIQHITNTLKWRPSEQRSR